MLELGLKGDEIRVVPHEAGWHEAFLAVQQQIEQATGLASNRIAHIGSTAVEAIEAKPIIDIMVGVDTLEDVPTSFFDACKAIGFYRLRVVRENEMILARFIDTTFAVKTHIIHLVTYEGEKWQDFTIFRDELRALATLRAEYEALKKAYIAKFDGNIVGYTEHKEAFVKRVVQEGKDKL